MSVPGREPTPALLARVASRFRALAEPARLAILHTLTDGPCTVSELVERSGLAQATVSKHLQQLLAAGFVSRRREGLFAWYALADDRVLALCELMCDRLADELAEEQAVLRGTAGIGT
jgi:DNA-binding transcriptional ArsR family regulator